MEGNFSHDDGVLTNQGIHHIDLLRYLGGEVKKVFCKMKTFGSKIQVEDTATATLEFINGAVGTIEVTTMQLDQKIMKLQFPLWEQKVQFKLEA